MEWGASSEASALIIKKNGFRNHLPGYPVDSPLNGECLLSTQTSGRSPNSTPSNERAKHIGALGEGRGPDLPSPH